MYDTSPSFTNFSQHEDHNPLRDFLNKRLSLGHVHGKVLVSVLTDVHESSDWKLEPCGPNRSLKEYLLARQMILVFQAVPTTTVNGENGLSTTGKKPSTEHRLVMGLTAWEYAFNDRPSIPSRVYLQYVDTTGLCRPRKLQTIITRGVTACYLQYCQEILQVPWVHLYISASPSLLFPGSESLPSKRILPDIELLCWWFSLIHSSITNADVYVYVPGQEYMPQFSVMVGTAIDILNAFQSGSAHWSYSLPYSDLLDSPKDNIPLFEDDPKWRHFEATYCPSEGRESQHKRPRRDTSNSAFMTVREFFQTLSLRTEFRQKASAFIGIKLGPKYGINPYTSVKKKEIAAFATRILTSTSFQTEHEAIKSSMKCWSWLQLLKSDFLEVPNPSSIIIEDPTLSIFGILRTSLSNINTYRHVSNLFATSNDVQSLIRRKLRGPETIGGNPF